MAAAGDQDRLAFGPFVVDRRDERLIGPAGPVKLGHKAYRVLLSLIEQEGKLLTKDALFDSVWDGTIVSESALTSAIKELRRALGDDAGEPKYIESVYGRGYRFVAEVGTAAEPAPAPREARAAPTPRPVEDRPPLVLVSAFHDEAVRDRFPHHAAGLREEVLSGLARFREIQLVADSRPEEAAAAERKTERGYLLTATLLPDGDGVKVIARAKRLQDGRILWAETMSLAATGTATGVETIVRRIVGAALPAVDEDLFLGLPRETDDLYDLYLIAKRRSFAAHTFAEAKWAADALERVIAERPGFALAYPPLARLYNTDFAYTALGATKAAERERALRLAKAGLAADRGHVHAYTLLGFCQLWHGQLGAARTSFAQAQALNPYNPVRLRECATGLIYMGDVAGARALIDKAAELDPIPDDDFQEDLGRLLMVEGDHDSAVAAFDAIIAGTVWAELYRAYCELKLGRAAGPRRLADWRERVAANWHSGTAPDAGALMGWIRFHNPFQGEAGEAFFSGIEEALAQAPEPAEAQTPRPRVPAPE